MTSSKPTVFFSPGAFHTPWVFDNVRSILSSRGFETGAAALLTAGTTDRNIGIYDDAANLHSKLAALVDEGKEVVLVGHSFGGLVISNAVEGLSLKQRASEGKPGGILILIYLTALAIPAGTDLVRNFDPNNLVWNDPVDGFIAAKSPLDMFYHDVEPSLAKKAVDNLTTMPFDKAKEPSRYEPWNNGFEVGYIFAEADRALPIYLQKAMASQFPDGYFAASIACGHSPSLSNPDELADAIQNAVEYVRKKTLSA
ncbi:Alpha/beta hydrolase fold-1 [Hypoxylon argillaceum]|nr:Alpha/beta hydrolase fold-1 [Hypoxylon argillaceum]